MPALGKYINNLPVVNKNEILTFISNNVFKNARNLNLLKTAYDSYIIHSFPSNYNFLNLTKF